jgi:hypothetical protein
LRELDLEAALLGVGVLREDVEDKRRPVEHLYLEFSLEVALLGWLQLVVEDDRGVAQLLLSGDDLLYLALADIRRRLKVVEPLLSRADNLGAGCLRQKPELFQRGVGLPAAVVGSGARLRLDRDEVDALSWRTRRMQVSSRNRSGYLWCKYTGGVRSRRISKAS